MVPKEHKMPTLDAADVDNSVRLKVGYNGSVVLRLRHPSTSTHAFGFCLAAGAVFMLLAQNFVTLTI